MDKVVNEGKPWRPKAYVSWQLLHYSFSC